MLEKMRSATPFSRLSRMMVNSVTPTTSFTVWWIASKMATG